MSSQDAKLLKPHALREPDRISYVLVVAWKHPFEKSLTGQTHSALFLDMALGTLTSEVIHSFASVD